MKIDKIIAPPSPDPGTTRKGDAQKPGIGFNEVLRQQMTLSSDSTAVPQSSVRPLSSVSALAPVGGALKTRHVIAQTLDTLDDYRQQLNDSRISLRSIAPTVGQMKSQVASLKQILADLPETNPQRSVVEEIHDLVDGEVDRFDSGYYVDP